MKRLLLMTCLLALSGLVSAAAPDFPAPPDARVTTVSEASTVNGLPISIRRFEVKRPVEWVLKYYRNRWQYSAREGVPGYLETEFGEWKMITRSEGDWFMSVQVQPDSFSSSWGHLALSNLKRGSFKALGSGVPMMNGSKVLNDTPSSDPGRKARTVMLSNSFSVSSNATYYRDYYTGRGWQIAMDMPIANGKHHALLFKRGTAEAQLTLQPAGDGTAVVANFINH